jgi:uncharacterized metal-binding protein YceD (DUF177 family)
VNSPEFSRPLDVRQANGKHVTLTADAVERDALARRFGLVRIDRLEASLALEATERGLEARGQLTAAIVQSCAVSGDDLPVTISEPLFFRFVPEAPDRGPDEEIELAVEDCDEIEFAGSMFDPAEAVAQSLALAIDPFARGQRADAARREAGLLGEGETGPFAALAALKGKAR